MKIRSLALTLALLPLHAEKEPNRFKKTQVLPKDDKDLPKVAMSSLWYIEVPQAQSEEDEFPSFEKALSWVKEGRAQVLEHSYHCSQPRQESFCISRAELIFPTEYSIPVFSDEWPTPTSLDTNNIGYSFETNVHSTQDNLVQARVSTSYRQELGQSFYHELMSKAHQQGDLSMPHVLRQGLHTGVLSPSSQTRLITSFNKFGDPTRTIHLYHAATLTPLAPLANDQSFQKAISLQLKILSVSTEDWIAYSQNHDLNELRLQTASWITNTESSIVRDETFTLTTGEKADLHRGTKHIYPTVFARPDQKTILSKTNPIIASEKDTRHLGLSLKTTPVLTKTGHLSLPYHYYLVQHVGERIVHRVKNGSQWEADATTPTFTLVTSKGGTFLTPNSETLLSVHAPLKENGDPDPSKRLLVFAKAH